MKDKKIYIAGHRGMVGSAIARKFQSEGYKNILGRTSKELNLIRQSDVERFFEEERPEEVVVAAAKVGGILANSTYRAQFIYENLMIESNIIQAAYKFGAKKLLFLGSSCIYPKLAPQPLKEEYLLTGALEETNEPYAIAKIAGIKLSESYYRQYGCNFISVMPTNLYGPFDNYNLETSHVMPALIRKFHEAKLNASPTVEVWGTGTPKREFLYVEDLADAVYYIMQNVDAKDLYDKGISHINIGTGEDLRISELVGIIADVIGFKGIVEYNTSKPDGTPRKLMDISRLHSLGWHHKTNLQEGIKKAYDWFLENYKG
jgi:GDP-L-fucose synthase